jgi:hypothetical protein
MRWLLQRGRGWFDQKAVSHACKAAQKLRVQSHSQKKIDEPTVGRSPTSYVLTVASNLHFVRHKFGAAVTFM